MVITPIPKSNFTNTYKVIGLLSHFDFGIENLFFNLTTLESLFLSKIYPTGFI